MSVSFKEKLELVRRYREGLIDPVAIRENIFQREAQTLAVEVVKIKEVFESRLQSMKQLFQDRLDEAREVHPMEAANEQKSNLEQTVKSLSIMVEEMTQDLAKARVQVSLERDKVKDLKGVLEEYEKALRIPETHWLTKGSNEFGGKVAAYNQHRSRYDSNKF